MYSNQLKIGMTLYCDDGYSTVELLDIQNDNTIKSCICLLYYMSLTVNFFVYARFNVVSANRW